MISQTRTISITSGKGGVGKTTICANLAHYLADKGRRVLIFDGDLGMSNVELMMQVRPQGDISDLLAGRKNINEILTQVNDGIWLISGGKAVDSLQNLDAFQRKYVLDAFSQIDLKVDDLIIDTSSGLNDNVLYLNSAASENVVVITPEPTSLSDAYAIIKTMNLRFKRNHFTIICNQVPNEKEARALFSRFSDVVSKFLTVGLDYSGCIVSDQYVRHSVSRQRLILKQFPDSEAARSMVRAFQNFKRNKPLREQHGSLDFFWNQLMGVA